MAASRVGKKGREETGKEEGISEKKLPFPLDPPFYFSQLLLLHYNNTLRANDEGTSFSPDDLNPPMHHILLVVYFAALS